MSNSYQQVFGGQNIYPAQLTFKNISLTADLTLEWPAEIATTNDVVAWIMRVSPTAGGFSIILDDATLASNGVSLLFYNAGAFTFTLKDSTGGTIASITAGTGWDIILRDNSTAAGSWLVIQRGAGTTEAQASQLAGAGLVALGGLLASSVLVTDRSSDFPITSTGRATLYDWTGGSGTATIDATSTLGTGWWAVVRNDGSGALTVTPASGQIDSSGSKVFDPNSAAFIFQDGVDLFTVGFGSGSGGTSFDYVSIDISGGSGGNYTLTGAQLNRIAYQFTGVLTGDVQVVIPSTVQEYWVTNATTGAFDVAVRTALQTPPGVSVGQGSSIIGYCNGAIFIQAAGTISTPVAVASGGTGATTASGARANLAAAGTAVDNNFSASQTVVSVDGGGAVGPLITAYRNSASPVATDILGGYNIDGNNSTPAQKTYASIQATILDKTAATEDATLDFLTIVAGALAKRGGFGQGFIIGAATDGGLGTIALASTVATMVNIVQTDAGAALGPILKLSRNSASPTTNDLIGALQLIGKDSGGNDTVYGQINSVIFSATDGSEGGQLQIQTQLSGSLSTANQVLIQGGNVSLTSTDSGAGAAPQLSIIRLSASPAANDSIGFIDFVGQDSAGNQQAYAFITGHIIDPTSTTESGSVSFDTIVAGSALTTRATVAQGLFMAGTTDPGAGKINATDVQVNGVSVSASVPVRQTVLSGPVDSSGLPNFGGSTGSTTVTASGTLISTASNGFSTGGVDVTGSIANPSWTGLSTNGTMYLYLDIAANGTCTTGSTILAPVYQWGGTYSVTSGQFTFNIQEMIGKVGNGATAAQTNRVFVGEVTVAGAVVTAITWYALMGRYYSPFTATLPGTSTAISFNHNIGTKLTLSTPVLVIECLSTDNGYAVGDQIVVNTTNPGGSTDFAPFNLSVTALTARFPTGGSAAFQATPKTGGTNVTLTAAKWQYAMTLRRGW